MTRGSSDRSARRSVGIALAVVAGLALVVVIALALSGAFAPEPADATPTAGPPSPTPAATVAPTVEATCPGEQVTAGLEAVLAALAANEVQDAGSRLNEVLLAYAGLIDEPRCAPLAQELLGIQALVIASTTWEQALESGSVRRAEEAASQAALAAELAPQGEAAELAAGLVAAIESRQATLTTATDIDQVITEPATLALEAAGGLHPLCEVNTVAKPLLLEKSGSPVELASRLVVTTDALYVLAAGQLYRADLDKVHGPSPAVFLQAAGPEDGVVAGAQVEELVDLIVQPTGELVLLEKSGRLLQRTNAGEWSLIRPAQPGEDPVAVAPYMNRLYLLDPAGNQIWRYQTEAGEYEPEYFGEEALRDLRSGADMVIDGAIYVARRDGRVRRYFVGVEDSNFQPDTDLGRPAAAFFADDPNSTLIYVIDEPGRRLLGLNRENGTFRLSFLLNMAQARPLTDGAILNGRLYLIDDQTLYITVLTATPTPSIDCPAIPFPPAAPFDRPALLALDLQLPVSATLPASPADYPGGRWPQNGYGVLEGLALTAPYSDSVRAIAPGTITRIITEPATLLESELGVISTTGRVPAEYTEALWGRQVWIDHGNGIETRYGGLAGVLPTLAEGDPVRRLTIIGFAGDEPVLLGIWVDGDYLGRGWLLPETVSGYRALFLQE
jgi:murein DD-endopeptidase MepM/ murein hydrolase activator NlpD